MNILFTCGGTAGHINPAIALARLFQERKADCHILFVGAEGGMEERLVPKEGFRLKTVEISSFHRKLNLAGVRHNLKTLRRLRTSGKEAEKILSDFRPDLVVGTGGYASYPVVREASKRGIPTAIHESNAVPGLTTKRLSQYVDCIMVGFEESRGYYQNPERVVVTGTPVRGEFFKYNKKEAKEQLRIPEERALVLSYWGSLGADHMNQYMIDYIEMEAKEEQDICHIHGAARSYTYMLEELKRRQVRLTEHIQIREYIYDMPLLMAAADLVLCRGGASTISELTAIGKAAIIVPSPNVTNRHQEKNAEVLAKIGGAVVLLEPECSGEKLYHEASRLLRENAKRREMEQAMSTVGIPDAADQIYQTLMKLMQEESK